MIYHGLLLIDFEKQFEKYSKTNDELKEYYESSVSGEMQFKHGIFAEA